MIQQTSLEAYFNLKMSGKLARKQQFIFDRLLKTCLPLTAAEIAAYVRMPINCVTPRLLELRKCGRVKRCERRLCSLTQEMAFTHEVVRV